MKYTIPLLILTAFASIFSLNENYYAWQIFNGLSFGVIIAVIAIGIKLDVLLALCWGWTMYSLLSISFLPITTTIVFSGNAEATIRQAAVTGIVIFLMSSIPFLILDREKARSRLIQLLALICFADSIIVLVEWAIGQDEFIRGGFFFNASMNSCMISGLLPFFMHDRTISKLPTLRVILPLLAVIASGSTGGYGAFILSVGLYYFFNKKISKKEFGLILIGLIALTIFAYFYLGSNRIITTSGRYAVWKDTFFFWKKFANHFVGFGQGSSMHITPVVQKLFQQDSHQLFLWMHNEWYQVLFEQGIIGFVLWFFMYINIIIKTFLTNEKYITVSIAVFGFICLFNYPFRMAIPGMIMAAIIYLGATSRKVEYARG